MARYLVCRLCLCVAAIFLTTLPASAQTDDHVTTANYRLAGRFAPYRINELIYSTSVTPRWIEV